MRERKLRHIFEADLWFLQDNINSGLVRAVKINNLNYWQNKIHVRDK